MVEEIKITRWMCDHTKLDTIMNEMIRDKINIAPIKHKKKGAYLDGLIV